jgi:hypothetical protein
MPPVTAPHREVSPPEFWGRDGPAALLTVIGLWLVLGGFLPQASGIAWLEEAVGGGSVLARLLCGFLFLYFSAVVREKNRLRRTLDGMMDIIRAHLGRGTVAPERLVVEALLRSLKSAEPETVRQAAEVLRRLTGQDFGSDIVAWESWWRTSGEAPKAGPHSGG